MSNFYQLKKIILIDSFWSGKTVLLNLDGHTNLSGTNGAGKTTFLRLMQLFWGERPSNIIGSSGSKKGFLDYYLPRSSSYLVYEYQRPRGQTCHVMVQSDGRGAKYKFIDAPYQQDLYIGENGFPRDSKTIDRLYRSNADTSPFIPVDDYCSIIQCHQVSSGKKSLRPLQQRYAMSATPMTHIEKVIGSVIEKMGDFDIIKQMLIDISRDKLSQTFLQQENDQNPFHLNKQHIDVWLADMHAAQELEAKRQYFDSVLQTLIGLKETLKELSHIHFLARNNHKACQQEDEALKQSLDDLSSQLDQLQLEFDQQLEPKSDALIEVKQAFKDLDFQIKALEEQKQDYEQQDAETFEFKASLLEQFAGEVAGIQAEMDALENKIQEIKSHYENQLSTLRHRHETQLKTYENNCTAAKLDNEIKLRQAEAHFQARKDQLSKQKDERFLPVNEQQAQLKQAFAVSRSRLQQPAIPEALSQQADKNRRALASIGKDTKLAFQTQAKAQADYQSSLDHYQELEQQLKAKKAEQKHGKQLHAQCLKRLKPEPNTLQYYLDNQVDGWQDNIGRVIAPELLESGELEPLWTDTASREFYGLRINLDRLADRSNLITDKIRLEQEEQALFTRLNGIDQDIQQLTASLNAANKLREQSNADLDNAKQQLKRTLQQEENLRHEAESLAGNIKVETAKALKDIQEESHRISLDIAANDVRLAEIQAEHERAMQALNEEHLARQGIIESDSANLIDTIEAQISTDKQLFDAEQTRISRQLQTDLQANGADTTIMLLADKLKATQGKVEEARSYQAKHKEFRSWLQQRWTLHPDLCRKQADCQSKIQQLNAGIEQLKQDFKRRRAQLNQQIGKQRELQNKNYSLLAQLGNCMDQLKSCAPICAENLPEYAAGSLPNLSQDTLQQFKRQEHEIHTGKQSLVSLFNKHHRSQLAEAWQQALAAPSQNNPFFQAEVLEIEQPLIDILQMVGHVKQATAQQIDLHASGVDTFYRHLHNFEREIKNTGTELSKYLSHEQYFAALGEITVNIRSKMQDLEYWQALKKFGDNYAEYRDNADLSGNNDVPEMLIQAMSELTGLLPVAGIKIRHLSLFDIEFSIRENGQIKQARNAKELKDVSSTGLSYLALITFFMGVTAMLRKQNPTVICWPIDELGDLAPENIEAMMSMLSKHNIQILSATPTADRHILSLFCRRYLLDKQKLHEVDIPESKLERLLNSLSAEGAAHV